MTFIEMMIALSAPLLTLLGVTLVSALIVEVIEKAS